MDVDRNLYHETNMKYILTIFFLTAASFVSNGQAQITIDGDRINLRDSLDGKIVLLSSIERGSQNRDALWITYDRRPGVDPWSKEAVDRDSKYAEETFIKYWTDRGVRILGAITTYDDCRCAKNKSTDSPDMYLVHFKIFSDDWSKLKEIYPEIENYVKKVRL